MGQLRKNIKSKEQLLLEVEKRFDYLSKDEREKLIYGNEFVKVPFRELQRLKINAYPYLMWCDSFITHIVLYNGLMMQIAAGCPLAHINPRSSFGFIGSNMQNEPTFLTKRFRVYCSFMATYFTEKVFEHYMMIEKSAYMLVRRTELEKNPELLPVLSRKFNQMYDFLDWFFS